MRRVGTTPRSGMPEAGLAALYEEAYLPMGRLAHLLTGSNEVGEEIVQDAFAQVVRRIDQLDNPGGYVRRSVVNCRRRNSSWSVTRQH